MTLQAFHIFPKLLALHIYRDWPSIALPNFVV